MKKQNQIKQGFFQNLLDKIENAYYNNIINNWEKNDMATAKNYTEEQVNMMTEAYAANPSRETVDSLAETLGKTTRSIIAKLSREGVYQAQPSTT